jgi:hypothetical protein
VVEPDVYFIKDGDDFIIQMNDEDVPTLRLNSQYKRMLDRDNGATKEVREYVRERYTSAIQLMKNIEQRKQTIMKVCQAIVRRQMEFLNNGLDELKPMMIKEVAEEVGVHPSTVSRAVSSKYVHTPQGVFELRYFFSEAVQGPSGGGTPLLLLKRKVKRMIDEEDKIKPLTDDQITMLLQKEGIDVTRRTVAKYREDMKIPSTHQRRIRLLCRHASNDAMDRLGTEMRGCRSGVHQSHVRITDLRPSHDADLEGGWALSLKGRRAAIPRGRGRTGDHETRNGGRRAVGGADAGVIADRRVRHADMVSVGAPGRRIRRIHLGGAGNPVIGRLHVQVRRKIGCAASLPRPGTSRREFHTDRLIPLRANSR